MASQFKDNPVKTADDVALCFPAPTSRPQKTEEKCDLSFKNSLALLKMSLTNPFLGSIVLSEKPATKRRILRRATLHGKIVWDASKSPGFHRGINSPQGVPSVHHRQAVSLRAASQIGRRPSCRRHQEGQGQQPPGLHWRSRLRGRRPLAGPERQARRDR